LTCSPISGSELFHARERYAVPHSCQAHQSWICGYVHVYKIIKQLFHACSGNIQNYCPSVLEMTCCWPKATVPKSSPAPRDNDCSGNSQNYCPSVLEMTNHRWYSDATWGKLGEWSPFQNDVISFNQRLLT
jgi:hypothetical protein